MTMVERTIGMSVDEFVRLYDEKGPFEIVDGSVAAKFPQLLGHATIEMKLLEALCTGQSNGKPSYAFAETAFILSDEPNWVRGSRVPDVMFIRAERLGAYKAQTPDWRKLPLMLVPD